MKLILDIDGDGLERLNDCAQMNSISIAEAAAKILRRGLDSPTFVTQDNGCSVFSLPPGSPKITQEHIQKVIEQMDDEDARRAWDPTNPNSS